MDMVGIVLGIIVFYNEGRSLYAVIGAQAYFLFPTACPGKPQVFQPGGLYLLEHVFGK